MSTSFTQERRRAPRLSAHYSILLHDKDGKKIRARCINLSTHSMGIEGVDGAGLKGRKFLVSFPEHDPAHRFQFRVVRVGNATLGLKQTLYCRLHGNMIPRLIRVISNGEALEATSTLNTLHLFNFIESGYLVTLVSVVAANISSFFAVILFHANFISQRILLVDSIKYVEVISVFLASSGLFYWLYSFLIKRKFLKNSADTNIFGEFALYHNEIEREVVKGRVSEQELYNENQRLHQEVSVLMDGLRSTGQQLQHITEMSGDLIWTTDLQGALTSGSNAFKEVIGLQPEEIKGKPLENLVVEQAQQEFRELLRKVRKGEKFHNFETLLKHKLGHQVDVSFNAMPIRNDQGLVSGISGTLTTLSEQKKIERSLRENQRLLISDSDTDPSFLDTTVEMDRVLSAQLIGVTQTTEQAAIDIMTRVQDLDERMTELVSYMTQANDRASDLGQSSRKVIEQDRQAITDLQRFIAETDARQKEGHKRVIEAMDKVRDLRKLVHLVLEISDRTNALSLNARIVAAQAGMQGMKFGVVAQEVRKLSGQVKDVANEIDSGIANAATTVEAVLSSQFDTTKMGQEENMLKKAAAQMALLGEHYGELLEFNQMTMQKVTAWNQQMSDGIIDLLGNIQFQDITRQRLEQVVVSLGQRRDYAQALIARLRDPHAEMPLEPFSADTLFQNYVMEDQRKAHHQATGKSAEPVSAMPMIQLF